MRIITALLILMLCGCSQTIVTPPSERAGTMFHYSGGTEFDCHVCKGKTHLFRVDKKSRVICDDCWRKSKKQYLYN